MLSVFVIKLRVCDFYQTSYVHCSHVCSTPLNNGHNITVTQQHFLTAMKRTITHNRMHNNAKILKSKCCILHGHFL